MAKRSRIRLACDDILEAARFLIDPEMKLAPSEAARIALVLAQVAGILLTMEGQDGQA